MADYRRREDIRFINPYTFIPVQAEDGGERTDAERQYHEEELHTGFLKCSIYVKTPLAIPDTEKGERGKKGKDEHGFFLKIGYIGEN